MSLFFPCHNEEANVEAVLRDALRIAPQVAQRYEILIIDDGSTDRTPHIVSSMASTEKTVRLVQHQQCQGYGEAVKSGLRAAQYPWIFFSDGDRQFDLSELPKLVNQSNDADIVAGYRATRRDPWYRLLNARIYESALRIFFGLKVRDVNCAFKLYRRHLFDSFTLKTSGALINAEIFARAQRSGARLVQVPVSHFPRQAGQPTGAKPQVIFKAMREFITLWRDL